MLLASCGARLDLERRNSSETPPTKGRPVCPLVTLVDLAASLYRYRWLMQMADAMMGSAMRGVVKQPIKSAVDTSTEAPPQPPPDPPPLPEDP